MEEVIVIGGGLAGSEASYRLANMGLRVLLYEMRPNQYTPAHRTDKLAELVCSNTLGSLEITSGAGLLKAEMEMLNSLIVEAGRYAYVPAGTALAVDRELFSEYITRKITEHPNIKLIREEVKKVPRDRVVIIASGPLTSKALAEDIKELIGFDYLYFYDAISPIVEADSVDFSKGFWASRYGKGGDDYFNCPLTEEEYKVFYEELLKAEKVKPKDFENLVYFEGCMPIEELAERGYKTLLFGPMKPVGLKDPHTRKEPFAVVQLRKENKEGTLLSLVGFQTRMTYSEQKRVLRLIPCLRNAVFVKLGSMHRNTFIQSNRILTPFLNMRKYENIFFAGQITGVEGYIASAGTGLLAGINAGRLIKGKPLVVPSEETMLGSLVRYITIKEGTLQPMSPVLGLLPPLEKKVKDKQERKRLLSERAIKAMQSWILELT
ncbi:FADH(2)-oxidizing methylenetetrahydrofolate--tRNA-(uracil(54)-C(5))-methyltransferase TrmFO [Hydrogenobacter sp. T-2]|uniref:FADH(2)-oxidizing methylenetetrahydrofolate--tRNA-(uracil(54)-C(5))- methyltransferase TrmFO n=1 Tax=Pampinifervens diazotrophicum TaxID=1632018 RepID=UPI002B25D0F2|nr:FADH(2)-oxidizing methylenetetrahydrofolate--tRNA-(uracil(54)-C(5))-methyltransferase TrmFO [Hydrogenobacter sp. T-2]WPM32631.1 FADH(2)-oxidizing methylenetetrahydrofolate--tRNA-(uracil(54)-C(5))-methyltransferase TrmFO [Hydrogenobacter sp. T-2]